MAATTEPVSTSFQSTDGGGDDGQSRPKRATVLGVSALTKATRECEELGGVVF
jgi:hypothetical protein